MQDKEISLLRIKGCTLHLLCVIEDWDNRKAHKDWDAAMEYSTEALTLCETEKVGYRGINT